ncbi:MAG: hypothetical protein AAF471_09105, partial [Myxococcota bacterium]
RGEGRESRKRWRESRKRWRGSDTRSLALNVVRGEGRKGAGRACEVTAQDKQSRLRPRVKTSGDVPLSGSAQKQR